MTAMTIPARQGYHILALALFLPALLTEPQLLALSLGIAAAALIAAEVLRVGRAPWIGPRIHGFMTAFIDSRDQGLLLISHFSLLIGMAVPLWLALPSLSPSPPSLSHQHTPPGAPPSTGLLGSHIHAQGDWVPSSATVAPALRTAWLGGWGAPRDGSGTVRVSVPAAAFAGIMILGVADSAASAVGRRYGRHKILQTHKSLEGTLGGMAFTLLGWLAVAVLVRWVSGAGPVVWGLSMGVAGVSWPVLAAAVVGSCLLETVTTQLDNIFLPLHHFALLAAS